MEEILSSIKRVIQEGGERTPRRGTALDDQPLPSLDPPEEDGDRSVDDDAEVLELTDPVDRPAPRAAASADRHDDDADETDDSPAAPAPVPPAAAPTADDEDQPMPTLASTATVEASRAALASLGRIVVKEGGGDVTLEAMVRDMLRPMLQGWLDANLPAIVERLVAAEVARIARDEN